MSKSELFQQKHEENLRVNVLFSFKISGEFLVVSYETSEDFLLSVIAAIQ